MYDISCNFIHSAIFICIKRYISFKKIFMGQEMLPGCGIKLVSWYQHSPTIKSCIVINRVSSTRISIKSFGPVNQAKYTVYDII